MNNSTCSICGKDYYVCLTCKSNQVTPWKYITDTPEHYQIHQIITGYNGGVYTKAEARAKLQALDLSELDHFVPEVKAKIKFLLAEDKPVVKTEDKAVVKADVSKDVKAKNK